MSRFPLRRPICLKIVFAFPQEVSYLPRKCLIYLINVLHRSEMSRLSQKCFTSLRNHLLCLRNVTFPLEMSGFTSEMSHFPQKIAFYSAINRSPPPNGASPQERPWGEAGKGGRVLHDFPQETFIQKHFFSPLNIYIFLPFFLVCKCWISEQFLRVL